MLFVQFRFLVFFFVIFLVHWAVPGNTARKVWLLLASHFFYACLFLAGPDSATAEEFPPITFYELVKAGKPLPVGWWFPVVLWASTVMDYVVGLGIGRSGEEWKRRAWLLVSLGVNLGVLGFFKYANFALESVHTGLTWFGLHTSRHTLEIFLPYGISFYTFQSMSYSIDVYRRRLEPVRSFLDLAFFISFFPQLVAGPIVRAMTFLPQVFGRRRWAEVDARGACTLFLIGFVKKACISECVAQAAENFFALPGKHTLPAAFVGITCYAVQIYCDFSGYTDMAIAIARLLGYELTPNFDFPYFSRNLSEFWRRWHISLSTWLRDYLYIPLGGNRGSRFCTWRNLMLTMVLGGLWHGASWSFVIWGGLHGLGLVVHREWARLTANLGERFHLVMGWIGVPLTFYWVLISWVFFRARDVIDPTTHHVRVEAMKAARQALQALCLFEGGRRIGVQVEMVWLLLALVLIHYCNYRRWISIWWNRLPDWAASALLGAGIAVAICFVPAKYTKFIYFQF